MEDPSLSQVKNAFIEGSGQLSASLLGILNKVCGQIFGLLLLSPTPLSLDDIVEELKVSKGNVSVNIRLLEDYQLVRQVWMKGSRRDYYEAVPKVPTKVIKEFLGKIRHTIQGSLEMIGSCQTEIEKIKDKTPEILEERKHLKEKLLLAESFFSAASLVFEALYAGKTLDMGILAEILKSD